MRTNRLRTLMAVGAALMVCSFMPAVAQSLLVKQGTATQICVNGNKMLLVGGELSNSAATSTADIDEVMPRMKALGLNTVLVPAPWDLLEPSEGEFDFSLIDRTIAKARENGLKVVLLWFGAWKNSMSCYAPLWFKQDVKRFPRAETASGKPMEIACAFSAEVLNADRRAFVALMQHIKAVDSDNTVVMMQVENEIGMLESARDHSAAASRVYARPLPEELRTYLIRNQKTLHPFLLEKLTGSKEWTSACAQQIESKLQKGRTWAEVFGTDCYGDEIFMAYFYASYVQKLAVAARQVKDMPLYVNAAMNSRGRKPSEYPSAGPLAHLVDIWKAGAPAIDMLSPDIYDEGFKSWADAYKMPSNPLFIPETRCCANSGPRALYAYGALDAIGVCPFAIDQAAPAVQQGIRHAYALINDLAPLLLKYQGHGQTHGVLFDQKDKEEIIEDGDMRLTCRHYLTLPWDARATDGSVWPEGAAIIMKLADNDYLIAGTGVVVTFQTASEKAQEEQQTLGEDGFAAAGDSPSGKAAASGRFQGKRTGIGYVDQVAINPDGSLKYIRRDNGDQTHQGRHARISVDEYKILHVRLYQY